MSALLEHISHCTGRSFLQSWLQHASGQQTWTEILQQGEMALCVQASSSAINQLMALRSKPCKATSLGCYMALRKQPNSQHAFAFLCRSFYFSGEITTARITLLPPQNTPWWLGGEWKPEPHCLVLSGQGFLFQWKVFPFQTSVFSLYNYLENFSFS